MYDFKMKLEPFGRYFVNADRDDLEYRTACGILGAAKELDIEIDKDLGLCYISLERATGIVNSRSFYCDDHGINKQIKEHPEYKSELQYVRNFMYPYMAHEYRHKNYTAEMMKHLEEGDMWGGTWGGHAVPEFNAIAKNGTDFYRDKVEKYRKKNNKDDFYDAILLTLDAIDILGERFGKKAEELLKTDCNEKQKRHLEIIRDTFAHCTKKPAENFAEAIVVFSMIYTLDGIDSPGYFDQYMYDFWKVTDDSLRWEYLENIWEFFHNTRSWNLTISGSDENWNDKSNELTYAILETTAKFKYQTPNLTMRCHRNTPPELLEAAYKAIASGCGMPTLYNDEVVCPALEALGIPPCDSHLYVMNGCNQIDIQGKSHMGLEDGEVCIAKAVELALHNGLSGKNGERLGPETGDPTKFKEYDEFYAAMLKQLDYITDLSTSMSNIAQAAFKDTGRNPIRSLLIEGCIESAADYKAGGPLYGHGQILAEAVADAIDSLAVMKKYVFEDKKYSMREMIDALDHNFEGYDELYNTVKNTDLKFGNDIEYVDSIGKDIIDHFNSYLQTIKTVRGGVFGGGCSPFNRAPGYGKSLAALPNGHKYREPLVADSIGAVPGNDINGPTALLNSCLTFNHKLATSGFILNIKFDKEIFNSEQGLNTFLSVYNSYFGRGGQQLSVTVVSADELKDAQVCPDKHRNLIVRVGGYSDYFVNLSKDLQDNVIARTDYKKQAG